MNIAYVANRILFAIVTFIAAVTADFLLPRLMGGNLADALASAQALGSPKVAAALRHQFGLDNPNLLYQYKQYIGQLLHGNMGISYTHFPLPVATVILQALPWTIGIVLTATIISYGVGWLIGIQGAWRRGGALDNTSMAISFFLYSVPYFWIGILIIMVFGFYLDWFPLGQAIPSDFNTLDFPHRVYAVLYHAILPIISMVLASMAGHIIVIRNNLLRVVSEDYMLLAKAKGLSTRRRKYTYAARNALLPSFTGLMTSLGAVVGGAITMEIVFSYPGIGLITFNAILNHDYPLIQGAFFFIAAAVVTANLIADLVYPLLDPRVALA